jgi:hypothetical protein
MHMWTKPPSHRCTETQTTALHRPCSVVLQRSEKKQFLFCAVCIASVVKIETAKKNEEKRVDRLGAYTPVSKAIEASSPTVHARNS